MKQRGYSVTIERENLMRLEFDISMVKRGGLRCVPEERARPFGAEKLSPDTLAVMMLLPLLQKCNVQ